MENQIQSARVLARLFLSAIPVFLLLGIAMHAFAGLPPNMAWVTIATTLTGVTTSLMGTVFMVLHMRHLENMLRAPKTQQTPQAQPADKAIQTDATHTGGASIIECLLYCVLLGVVLFGAYFAFQRTVAEVAHNDIAMTPNPVFVVVEDAPARYPGIQSHTVAYAILHNGSSIVCSLDSDKSRIWRISGDLDTNRAPNVRSLLPTQTLVDFCARATQQ